MGKIHSKLSSKRRQSPEGGVFASTSMSSQREFESDNKETNMCRVVKSNNCTCKVALPPEQRCDRSSNVLGRKQLNNNEHIHSANQQRHTIPVDVGQEWLFTLCHECDNGNSEDMSNLLLELRKAINASVRPASDTTEVFKIKIVLSSEDQHKFPLTEKEPSSAVETGRSVRRLYCVGENIERRNHYLDLAGIENFSSKFDNEESLSQEPLSPHQHHPVVTSDNCPHPETSPAFSVSKSTKTKVACKEEQSCRFYGHRPASHCPSSHLKHRTNGPVHRSHSKRLRPLDPSSPRRPACCPGQAGRAGDIAAHLQPHSCSPLVRHHHLHEHHHHHHHHHYHAA